MINEIYSCDCRGNFRSFIVAVIIKLFCGIFSESEELTGFEVKWTAVRGNLSEVINGSGYLKLLSFWQLCKLLAAEIFVVLKSSLSFKLDFRDIYVCSDSRSVPRIISHSPVLWQVTS